MSRLEVDATNQTEGSTMEIMCIGLDLAKNVEDVNEMNYRYFYQIA
tara:strand:+ start:10538 stop:10675 length:138 start_codon:yes stop_codon:yes gene_type:complete